MPTPDTPSPDRRLRASHVVWALIALVVFSACGSALVRTANERAEPAPLLVTELEEQALLMKLDGGAGGPDLDALSPVEDIADDGMRFAAKAETKDRVDDALIVRTAHLELEVEDVASVLLDARAEIASLGGYVSGSDEYDQGDRRWASVTYRVPVDRFADAIDALRGLSDRVARESTQSQEVTATVVDLDARITNLRASEESLIEIMDRSGRMEDVLAVQTRLEDVRGQIEQLEAQRTNLADQAALSTLSVSWFTPVAAVTVAREGWNVAAEVDAALAQTVEALQGVGSLGIWFGVVALPLVGIPLLLVALLALRIRRRTRHGGDAGGPDGGAAVSAAAAE